MSKIKKYQINLSNGEGYFLENVDRRNHYDGWVYFYVGSTSYEFNLKYVTQITEIQL